MSKILRKQLGGVEDLLLDARTPATVTQTRDGASVVVTKINADTIPYEGIYGDASFKSLATRIAELTAANIEPVNSVADLASFSDKDTVYLLGYYDPADGGGGLLYYDPTSTAVVDNGSIFAHVSGTGRWLRQNTGRATARQFGAKGDGTTDDSTRLQAMFDSDARTFEFEFGTYKVASEVLIEKSVTIIGNNSTIDTSSVTGLYGLKFDYSTAVEELPAFNTALSEQDTQLNFVSAVSLDFGQYVCIHDQNDYSFSLHRSYYQSGEFVKIYDSISGSTPSTTYTIYGTIQNDYSLSANLKAFKYNTAEVEIENLNLNTGANTYPSLYVDSATKVVLTNCSGSSKDYTSVRVHRSVNVFISSMDAVTRDIEGDGSAIYGISVSNSSNVTITSGVYSSEHHAIALGGAAGDCCIPTRNVSIYGCYLYSTADLSLGASDIHGNCEFVTYDSCVMLSGGNMAGRHVTYNNCTIYSRTGDGNCIYGSEIVGGNFSISDCRFFSDGLTNTVPIVSIRSSWATREDVTLKISDVYAETKNDTNGAFVQLTQNNTPIKTNMSINGLDINDVDGTFLIVSYPRDFNTFYETSYMANPGVGHTTEYVDYYADYHTIDNVSVSSSVVGIYLMYADSTTADVPLRIQRQSGHITLTTDPVSNIVTNTTPVPYKYIYPKSPVGLCSSNLLGFVGGKAVNSYVYDAASDDIRVALVTSDAAVFGVTEDVKISWSAEISEV